jgi:hypothetical protein
MPAITSLDLSNAKLDVDHIAAIATSLQPTATDRLGHTKDTISGAIYKIAGFTDRGVWATITNYQVKDLVSVTVSSVTTWYVCVVQHTSSTVFNADSSKWRIYQGVTTGDLSSETGASIVGYGQSTVETATDGARTLSYYGPTQAGLLLLLDYARVSGKPIKFDSDVTLSDEITVDFSGNRCYIDFSGYCIYTDKTVNILNPGNNGTIISPDLRNRTAPWAITRWDSSGNWLSDSSVLATLTQTNNIGYYQPTVNDTTIWGSLTTGQQNQAISPKLRVYSATNMQVLNPRGRYVLYEFDMCNYTNVVQPQILCGGKGQYGTVVFKNLDTTGYGIGNFVRGGFINYGSFSGVGFMRNKSGGVVGGFSPYRSGESGVKTYQNEVSGRSSRNYNMFFSGIYPEQTVYDGVDFNADFGTPSERVDDYSLATYAWNMLPTCHKIHDIRSKGCKGIGIWGDGQFNEYSDTDAANCLAAGIFLRVSNCEITGATSIDCCLAGIQHQIIVEGPGNRLLAPRVHTSSSVTVGNAIYCSDSSTVTLDERVTGSRLDVLLYRADTATNNIRMGTSNISQNTVMLDGAVRDNLLTASAGRLTFLLSNAVVGNEQGAANLQPRSGGQLVNGFIANPNLGGHGQIGIMTAYNAGYIAPGHVSFHVNGTQLGVIWKTQDGVVRTGNISSV